ncbi:unnamed protein product [Aphis gossypii]|uniref:Uncharacterized protein n=1 Tax=Aphis gossypii TaxID=80765 RepID=A0A9P0NN08_APHGO|nr:unnamed protein product [Aphis gossypii]CAH1726644.1 unnamed protein product [Aphis gossypii]
MYAAQATGEGHIHPRLKLFSHASHTYYFLSHPYVHRKGNAGIPDQHLWGFPPFCPALSEFFTFCLSILVISTFPPAGWKKVTFHQYFNRGRKPNFRCRRDKKYIYLHISIIYKSKLNYILKKVINKN